MPIIAKSPNSVNLGEVLKEVSKIKDLGEAVRHLTQSGLQVTGLYHEDSPIKPEFGHVYVPKGNHNIEVALPTEDPNAVPYGGHNRKYDTRYSSPDHFGNY